MSGRALALVSAPRARRAPRRSAQAAFEDCLRAIYELREAALETRQARLVERLGVTRPVVSDTVARLREAELVVPDRSLALTPAGEAHARQVVRRQRLAERFLTDCLGLGLAAARTEADKWEHVLNPSIESRLVRLLGEPTTCPHGNPIPGMHHLAPATVALAMAPVGFSGEVVRIAAAIEGQPGVLELLVGADLVPGRPVQVLASSAQGAVAVRVRSTATVIAPDIAAHVHVTAEGVDGVAPVLDLRS